MPPRQPTSLNINAEVTIHSSSSTITDTFTALVDSMNPYTQPWGMSRHNGHGHRPHRQMHDDIIYNPLSDAHRPGFFPDDCDDDYIYYDEQIHPYSLLQPHSLHGGHPDRNDGRRAPLTALPITALESAPPQILAHIREELLNEYWRMYDDENTVAAEDRERQLARNRSGFQRGQLWRQYLEVCDIESRRRSGRGERGGRGGCMPLPNRGGPGCVARGGAIVMGDRDRDMEREWRQRWGGRYYFN